MRKSRRDQKCTNQIQNWGKRKKKTASEACGTLQRRHIRMLYSFTPQQLWHQQLVTISDHSARSKRQTWLVLRGSKKSTSVIGCTKRRCSKATRCTKPCTCNASLTAGVPNMNTELPAFCPVYDIDSKAKPFN